MVRVLVMRAMREQSKWNKSPNTADLQAGDNAQLCLRCEGITRQTDKSEEVKQAREVRLFPLFGSAVTL